MQQISESSVIKGDFATLFKTALPGHIQTQLGADGNFPKTIAKDFLVFSDHELRYIQNRIAQNQGEDILYNMGERMAKSFKFSSAVNDLEKALITVKNVYSRNRNNYVHAGIYLLKYDDSMRRAYIHCNTPFHAKTAEGFISTLAKRFTSLDARVSIHSKRVSTLDELEAEAIVFKVAW